MEIIKKENTQNKNNSDNCLVTEYTFKNKNLDLGIANITGRYPDKGFCLNEKSDELIYIIDGNGKIILEDKIIEVSKEDAVIIKAGELYYWNTDNFMKAAMICNPAFNPNQYKNIIK